MCKEAQAEPVGGIQVGEFLRMLWTEWEEKNPLAAGLPEMDTDLSGALYDYGRHRGWLEEEDELARQEVLDRRRAARILHEFLRRELGERDEADWGPARELADLYDCRVCVNHVAQIYVKGILQAKKYGRASGEQGLRFGMRDPVSYREAGELVRRGLDPSARLRIGKTGAQESCRRDSQDTGAKEPEQGTFGVTGAGEPLRITMQEALELKSRHPEVRLMDVRTRSEYRRGHAEGLENIPLMELLERPRPAGEDLSGYVILFCDGGYRSQVAAQYLSSAGYEHVYYL